VSEATAKTAASEPSSGPASSRPRRWPGGVTPAGVVIVVATLVALGLRIYYQYGRAGFLLGVNEYDDGPYFGSAVRLVQGSVPYRDFVFVQPPGITLLMAPVGLVTKVIGTAWGMAIGRILTVLAGSASVVLGGLLVRHRGLVAVVVTCGVLAIYPDAVAAAHTVLVEPWLVLACLVGAVAVFDGDRLAGTRRLAWGGVAFGFAGAVEAWAIVPVIVLCVFLLPQLRRAVVFAAGAAVGFLVPALPFAALAPRQFYHSLITAQIGYRAHALRVGPYYRIREMAGLPDGLHLSHGTVVAVAVAIVAFILLSQAAASALTRRLPPLLDLFAMLTVVLVAAMFMWPPQFHYHFSAFMAPFLGLSAALAAARLTAAVQPLLPAAGPGRWLPKAAAGAAAVVLTAMAVVQASTQNNLLKQVIGPVPATIGQLIPKGTCVLTDQVSITILANRFTSNDPGCPQMVDTLGTDLALSHGRKPATGAASVPAVAAAWQTAFSHAQYVLLTHINARRVAWTPQLHEYLDQNFRVVYVSSSRLTLYARNGLPR
jgi:hypothetical protein